MRAWVRSLILVIELRFLLSRNVVIGIGIWAWILVVWFFSVSFLIRCRMVSDRDFTLWMMFWLL